jgi:hypothetical protein
MKYLFKIGEHEIGIERRSLGMTRVSVDQKEILRRRLTRHPIQFKVGKRTVELRVDLFGRVRCLVDGTPVKRVVAMEK